MSKESKAAEGTVVAALGAFNLGSDVKLDDVADIYVSQYEENVIAKRDETQANIKTIRQEHAVLVQKMTDDVTTRGTEELKSKVALLTGGLVQFVLNEKSISIRTTTTGAEVAAVGQLKLNDNLAIEGLGVEIPSNHYSRTPGEIAFSLEVKYNADDMSALKEKDEALANLRENLQKLNGALQDVNRMARRVRAELARQKLKESGSGALLDAEGLVALTKALPKLD